MKQFKQILWKVTRLVLLCSLVCLFVWPVLPVQAHAVVFVSPGGSGPACSQSAPCSLVSGLLLVDSGGTVYGAPGTYTGTGNQVVLLQMTIDFLGGWNGAPSGPIVRDPALYESILNGGDTRRVITVTGSATVTPLIDGWTITGGNATDLPDECKALEGTISGCGGGIYVNTAEPTISHNKIWGNKAAISVTDDKGAGGGIYVIDSGGTLIQSNDIYANDSHINGEGDGGGIYIRYSGGKTSVIENDIHDNEGSSTIIDYHSATAIYVISNTDQIQIYKNRLHDNNPSDFDPEYYGGVIYVQYCDNKMLIDENIIYDNHGAAAIMVGYAAPTIQQNILINPGTSIRHPTRCHRYILACRFCFNLQQHHRQSCQLQHLRAWVHRRKYFVHHDP